VFTKVQFFLDWIHQNIQVFWCPFHQYFTSRFFI
jgi:hypothetical protein